MLKTLHILSLGLARATQPNWAECAWHRLDMEVGHSPRVLGMWICTGFEGSQQYLAHVCTITYLSGSPAESQIETTNLIFTIESHQEAEVDKPCPHVCGYMSGSKVLKMEDGDEVHGGNHSSTCCCFCCCCWRWWWWCVCACLHTYQWTFTSACTVFPLNMWTSLYAHSHNALNTESVYMIQLHVYAVKIPVLFA